MNLGHNDWREVCVVDDDEAARDSLRWLLDSNGFRATAYQSAEEFLSHARLDQVGCLLLDVRMPGMSGIELQDELIRRDWRIPLIVITGHGDVPMAVASMKKGAVDFLQKPFNDWQLCMLVRQALAQRSATDEEARVRQAHMMIGRLTQRERQVLDRIVDGRLNKQIAEDLGISIKTVEAHRANLMEKMQARSVADLMRVALRIETTPGR